MSSGDCAQTRTAPGVQLLGAIEPHEWAQLTDHLASRLACDFVRDNGPRLLASLDRICAADGGAIVREK